MRITRTTQPAVEPVTLDELKRHCRITWDDDDADLTEMGVAARELIEKALSRSLITTTWTMHADYFSFRNQHIWQGSIITLPIATVQEVTSVSYSLNGVVTDYTQFQFSPGSPGRIASPVYQPFPFTYGELDSVTVVFTAGYGDTADDVPDCLKRAIKLLVSHMYENREAVSFGTGTELPYGVERLISTEKWRCW